MKHTILYVYLRAVFKDLVEDIKIDWDIFDASMKNQGIEANDRIKCGLALVSMFEYPAHKKITYYGKGGTQGIAPIPSDWESEQIHQLYEALMGEGFLVEAFFWGAM